MSKTYDVVIIGAGAAGLCCANELRKSKINVLVLEARGRVGGRMLSVPAGNMAVELGAEFIHGADKAYLEELARAHVHFIDVPEHRYYLRGRKLVKKGNFFEEIQRISKRLRPDLKVDRPVSDFLNTHKIKSPMRSLYINYVEGFHAADTELISERALARTEQAGMEDLNQIEQFRPINGYGELLEYWVGTENTSQWLQLESVVQRVEWKRGEVILHGTPFSSVKTKRVVVTVPIGVLKKQHQLSGIEFDPFPKELALALEGVHMGYIERITFEFTSRFWESLTKEPISFIHTGTEDYFSTWWTQHPRRTPFLTAWQGGPKALELAHWPVDRQIDVALKTLSKITGRGASYLKKQMRGFYLHNWASDPFSLGAYSYVAVGGEKKIQRLLKPFEDTLYFAGEALALNNAEATVHGARATGLRVAKQIIAANR